VTIKIKSRTARQSVENFTSTLVIMLILAAISIIPVRIIVYAPRGTKESASQIIIQHKEMIIPKSANGTANRILPTDVSFFM